MKKTLFYGAAALGSVFIFAFFALPYIVFNELNQITGYEFLENLKDVPNLPSQYAFALVIGLITLIVAGLAIVSFALALLNHYKIIKDAKFAKIIKWVAFGLSIALMICTILNLVGNQVFLNYLYEGSGLNAIDYTGWAHLILTNVCGIGQAITCSIATFSKR